MSLSHIFDAMDDAAREAAEAEYEATRLDEDAEVQDGTEEDDDWRMPPDDDLEVQASAYEDRLWHWAHDTTAESDGLR